MELWETRVEIPADAAAPVELVLLESGVGGWTLLEDAVAKRAWIVGIFQDRAEAEAQWAALRPALPVEPLGAAVPRLLPDADWKNSYREHFRAWTFGRLHWVPVWERETFRLPAGHSVLWLDPGLAFGTGNHETTRLCVERLVEFDGARPGGPAGLRALDAGCGSGILALSAALLGFGDASGFDIDPEAVRVSFANAELNGMSGRVRFSTAGLPEGLSGGPSDVLLANIQADILIRHCGDLAGAVAPGGVLVLSGILAAEIGTVREAFAPATHGWGGDSRVLGEWCDLCLRRPAR
jgi:ribosomal protein L11 methyltransferase